MTALSEFRLILLGLCVVFILGIWWAGARRARRAAARPEPDPPAPEPAAAVDARSGVIETREWGVPPFEPLSIRTAEFEQVPVMDLPVMTSTDLLEATQPSGMLADAAGATRADATAAGADRAPPASSVQTAPPSATPAPPGVTPAPPAAESGGDSQRIVTLRVCALEDARWPGAAVLSALEQQGLTHGRYQVFHRKHDGSTLFCAASLVEPGIFDPARMPEESYRGLTLFAVLPGPLPPLQMFDVLFVTAQDIARSLRGEVQDAKGEPLSAARAAELREDVARFQAPPNR